MTSIIFLFDMVHLYDLFCDELVDDIVEEIDIKEILKSSILVVQKATAPKFGVEFCQGSIGAIKSSYAVRCTLYAVRCTLYAVRCTLYAVRCTSCNVTAVL